MFLIAAAALICVLSVVVVYRAATQSITYDEAFTYLHYASGSPQLVFTSFSANNHVLFSLLAHISTRLFGLSELTLRLPSVLAAIAFLCGIVDVGRLMVGTRLLFLLTVGAITLNPFVLDLLCAARGYSLGLACLTWATDLLLRALMRRQHAFDARWLTACVLLSLAVTANLTFAWPAGALFCAAVVADFIDRPTRPRLVEYLGRLSAWYVAPAALTAALLLGVPLSQATRSHFTYGAPTLVRSVASLVDASVHHDRPPWPPDPRDLVPSRLSLVLMSSVLPLVAAVVCVLIVRIGWRLKQSDATDRERCLALLGGGLVLVTLLLVVAHWAVGLPYPLGRTGIYLIVMFLLVTGGAAAALLDGHSVPQRALGSVLMIGLAVLVGRSVQQFDVSYFYEWRFDAGTKDLFDSIPASHSQARGMPLRVAASPWLFGPSLNFYRVALGRTDIAPVSEDWAPDPSRYHAFVVAPGGDLSRARQVADIVFIHPESHAVLLLNRDNVQMVEPREPAGVVVP
jgi:hypothetical protein